MSWISPTGHNDPDSVWTDDAKAYDDDTGSFAWSYSEISYLELTLGSAISCDKVQIFASDYYVLHYDPDIDIDVYYSDSWHNIFSGVISKQEWVEKSIGSVQSVSAARIKFNQVDVQHIIYEFDFGEIDVTPKASSDSGSAEEASSQVATFVKSETGQGADAQSDLLGELLKSEVGSAVEVVVARLMELYQDATGVDVAHLDKIVFLSQVGSAVEASYLKIVDTVLEKADSGSGVDVSYELKAIYEKGDTGQGLDAVMARAIFAKEYPTGAIDLAKEIQSAITKSDTGAGVESSLREYLQHADDSGSGSEATTLISMFQQQDLGSGAEAITIAAIIVSQETGIGVDSILEYFRELFDSGEGVEFVNLIGMVGRMMKLITYLQHYHQVSVFTRPYHQVKVFTAEYRAEEASLAPGGPPPP